MGRATWKHSRRAIAALASLLAACPLVSEGPEPTPDPGVPVAGLTWAQTVSAAREGTDLDVRTVLPRDDGGFFLMGEAYLDGRERLQPWVARLAADGAVVWSRTYGDPGPERDGVSDYDVTHATEWAITSDGGLCAAGSDDTRSWLARLDADLSLRWARVVMTSSGPEPCAGQPCAYHPVAAGVLARADGGCTAFGTRALVQGRSTGPSEPWVVGLDAEGDEETRFQRQPFQDVYGVHAATALANGDVLLSGSFRSLDSARARARHPGFLDRWPWALRVGSDGIARGELRYDWVPLAHGEFFPVLPDDHGVFYAAAEAPNGSLLFGGQFGGGDDSPGIVVATDADLEVSWVFEGEPGRPFLRGASASTSESGWFVGEASLVRLSPAGELRSEVERATPCGQVTVTAGDGTAAGPGGLLVWSPDRVDAFSSRGALVASWASAPEDCPHECGDQVVRLQPDGEMLRRDWRRRFSGESGPLPSVCVSARRADGTPSPARRAPPDYAAGPRTRAAGAIALGDGSVLVYGSQGGAGHVFTVDGDGNPDALRIPAAVGVRGAAALPGGQVALLADVEPGDDAVVLLQDGRVLAENRLALATPSSPRERVQLSAIGWEDGIEVSGYYAEAPPPLLGWSRFVARLSGDGRVVSSEALGAMAGPEPTWVANEGAGRLLAVFPDVAAIRGVATPQPPAYVLTLDGSETSLNSWALDTTEVRDSCSEECATYRPLGAGFAFRAPAPRTDGGWFLVGADGPDYALYPEFCSCRVCENTCGRPTDLWPSGPPAAAFDRVCDDGGGPVGPGGGGITRADLGESPPFGVCPYGSDCCDCGPRLSMACTERGGESEYVARFGHDVDLWVGFLRPDGTIDGGRVFGTAGFEQGYGVAPTPDGGVLAWGVSDGFRPDRRLDPWLLKLDQDLRTASPCQVDLREQSSPVTAPSFALWRTPLPMTSAAATVAVEPVGLAWQELPLDVAAACRGFVRNDSLLAVQVRGPGRVRSEPGGIDCVDDCTRVFPRGAAVTLTARANPGAELLGWEGDCAGEASAAAALLLDRAEHQCAAVFGFAGEELVAPVAAFGVDPPVAMVGQTVTLDGSASSDADGVVTAWAWDFGNDGSFDAEGAVVTRSWSAEGTYPVRLRVTDDDGQLDDARGEVVVRGAVVARISPASPRAVIDEVLTLDGGGSTAPVAIASWSWDLDGDGLDDAEGATVERSWPAAGTYPVRLRVTDAEGFEAIATAAVVVDPPGNRRPQPLFFYDPDPAVVGRPVSFDGSPSVDFDGEVVGFYWDFDGDGRDDATGARVTHPGFDAPGRFPVTLVAVDDEGADASYTLDVVVLGSAPPAAALVARPESAVAGARVTLDASGSTAGDASIVRYAFDQDGDGVVESEGAASTFLATYATAGVYTARVVVTDAAGATDDARATVTVSAIGNRTPVACYADPGTVRADDSVFLDASCTTDDGTIVQWAWDWTGDGTYDSVYDVAGCEYPGCQIHYSWPTPGAVRPTLRVTDDGGLQSTFSRAITVDP